MTTPKLHLVPVQATYAASIGNDIIRAELDGGSGRYRRDIIGATATVSVRWQCNGLAFQYLQAFYRTTINNGADPFFIDLILDGPEIREYKAHFLPGSLMIASTQGFQYIITANLEAEPLPVDEEYDNALVAAFEAFGRDAVNAGEELDEFTNEHLPEHL